MFTLCNDEVSKKMSNDTKFCEIFPLLLTTVHTIKSKVDFLQNFVAFTEYMNLNVMDGPKLK